MPTKVRVPAIEIRQSDERVMYSFAVDGRLLPQFAAISRVRRDGKHRLFGYQRTEVLSHIAEIRRYLESSDPLLPNSVVLALDESFVFRPLGKQTWKDQSLRIGSLTIPVDPTQPDDKKPAWVVDGQQRIAAIQESALESFPISVVGFQARDDQDQREQFILVNSTKPLPKGLVYELLPTTNSLLPERLRRRRFPAFLLEKLNYDDGSSFRGLIRTPTSPDGVIKDNSVLRMLENSLSDGILYWYRDHEDQIDTMLAILNAYWGAVRQTFPDAWGLSPRKSRLMHGAGILALGMLMDAIAESYRREGPAVMTKELFLSELEPITDSCSWTGGYWHFRNGERRKWNELQNITRDIQLLADHLLTEYKACLWDRVAV